jgi:hypothetical protein
MSAGQAATPAAEDAAARVFHVRRPLAWGRFGLGWVLAQSLLTLIPIAPPGWGTPFLLLTGGGFALWSASGLLLALRRTPLLVVSAEGLDLSGRRLPWRAIAGWRVVEEERRIALALADPEAARGALPPVRRVLDATGVLPARGSLGFDGRLLDARLTEVAGAFREYRPDLENPA